MPFTSILSKQADSTIHRAIVKIRMWPARSDALETCCLLSSRFYRIVQCCSPSAHLPQPAVLARTYSRDCSSGQSHSIPLTVIKAVDPTRQADAKASMTGRPTLNLSWPSLALLSLNRFPGDEIRTRGLHHYRPHMHLSAANGFSHKCKSMQRFTPQITLR